MALSEEGYIQFSFVESGADGVKKALEIIRKEVRAGETSFKSFEKAALAALKLDNAAGVTGLTNRMRDLASEVKRGNQPVAELDRSLRGLQSVAPGVASALGKMFDADPAITYMRAVDQIEKRINKVNSAARTNAKADALGVQSPVAAPAVSRDEVDKMLAYTKAANSNLVADAGKANQQIASSYQKYVRVGQKQAFEARKREVGEIAALEERATRQQSLLGDARAQLRGAKGNDSVEGLKQEAAAMQLVAQRTAALDATNDQLYGAYQRVGAARKAAYQDSKDAEALRSERQLVTTIGQKEAAQRKYNAALKEEQQGRGLVTQGRATGGEAGMAMQTRGYNQIAASIKKSESALVEMNAQQDGIISQRYALYDIANIYGLIGGAITAAGIGAVVVGAQFESAFTNVERTLDPLEATAAGTAELRNQLVQLQRQVPLSFAELSQIATIGNQMGIADDRVIDFTTTIARFASVSGMSIDSVSAAFGGFMAQTGLSADYLENLGSSLALVSIRSNATEATILSLSRELAASTSVAGFAADEIVGLAGAFASLQVAPERARGVFDTYMGSLTKAVSTGGAAMEDFSRITGETGESLTRLVNTGQGAEVFTKVLEGLGKNSSNVTELTANLDALGLGGLRASNTFQRMVSQLEVASDSFSTANEGFMEGAELNRQYAKTLEDLGSQWTIFVNGLNSVVDAISGGAISGMSELFQVVNRVVYGFAAFLNGNKVASTLLLIGVAAVSVVGIMALVASITFRARASMIAFQVATHQAAKEGIQSTGVFRGLAASLFGVGNGARAGASGMRAFRAALVSTGVGALLVGAGLLAEKFFELGDSVEDNSLSMEQYNQVNEDLAKQNGLTGDSADEVADSFDGAGNAAKEAAEKIRTLVDYAGNLSGVFNRSFDLRFGVEDSQDAVTKLFNDIIKQNDDAAKKILELRDKYKELGQSISDSRLKLKELKAELNGLKADLSMQRYFLSIALEYGDDKRAEQLRAEIAKTEADIASNKGDVAKETGKINDYEKERVDLLKQINDLKKQISDKPLRGDTEDALKNRDAIRSLLDAYREELTAMAESGASKEELATRAAEMREEFLRQSEAIGFSRDELGKYGKAFDDMVSIIQAVPRNVTPVLDRPDLGPAELALAEFFEKAKADAALAGAGAGEEYGDSFGGGVEDGAGWELPEPEDDAAEKGEETAKQMLDGMLVGVGMWAGSLARNMVDLIVTNFKDYWTNNDAISKILGAIPIAGTYLKSWYDAGSKGAKEAERGADETGEKTSWLESVTPNLGGLAAGFLGSWFGAGKRGAEEYDSGVAGTANPDGEISKKIPTGLGGGGKGGMSSTSRMGNLGVLGANEYNTKVKLTTNPDSSISTKIEQARNPLTMKLGSVGTSGGNSYNASLGAASNAAGKLTADANASKTTVAAAVGRVGSSSATSYNQSLANGADTSGRITTNINAADVSAGQSASSLGYVIATSINDGISGMLDALLGSSGTTRKLVRKLTGFSGGGYTGSGHWLQPAGVVHAGEYVIPKRYVDQRTKLPDMSYVQSLHSGQRAAPKLGYATGGMVGGAGGAVPVSVVGTVELGARTLHTLKAGSGGGMSLSDGMIGAAAARSYQKDSLIGAG